MSWYLLVFLSTTLGGLHEGFMWYNPTFENKQECIDWAKNNPAPIIQTLNYYYDDWTIENVLCVREDRLEDFNMVPHPGNSTET